VFIRPSTNRFFHSDRIASLPDLVAIVFAVCLNPF
jgi:hypothetical protein